MDTTREKPKHAADDKPVQLAGIADDQVSGNPPQPQAAAPDPPTSPQYVETSQPADDGRVLSWTSTEFIADPKPSRWYGVLALATVLLAAVIWILTRDLFATATVIIGMSLIGVYSRRQPQEQQYIIDTTGVTIGSRRYAYGDFRSFSLNSDGPFSSIELMPMKRFAMFSALYFNHENADEIVGMLSNFLPMEEHHSNIADNVLRKIHF